MPKTAFKIGEAIEEVKVKWVKWLSDLENKLLKFFIRKNWFGGIEFVKTRVLIKIEIIFEVLIKEEQKEY